MAIDLTLLFALSTPRRAAGSPASAVSTASQTPDARRHSAVCCCRLCEQCGTGEQAMRSVGGDYRRFLARVDILPSALLSASRCLDAADVLVALLCFLLPRRSV